MILGAITGSIAAYYGIPANLYNKGLSYLDEYLINIHDMFYNKYLSK